MSNRPIPLDSLCLADIESGHFKAMFPNCTIGLQSDLAIKDAEKNLNKVYSDLKRIFQRIEMHPIHREHDSEDRTSLEIVHALRLLNHTSEHEASYGGNCDICINENDEFIWLGEAKIDYNNTHIMEGFRQLTDRYMTGNIKDGGLLIYCKSDSPSSVLKKWKGYLTNKDNKLKEYSIVFTKNSGSDFFETQHLHKSSNNIITIRHMAISLFDIASDKSACKKKKCSHTCTQCCPTPRPDIDELVEYHI